MQFVIARGALQKELSFVQGVVERKNTIPVLANILIESAGENAIRISGTDLDVTIRCDADADPTVETAGSAHIESGLFHTHIHWARGSAQSRSSTAADNFRNVCQSSAAGVTERYSRQIRVKAARSGPGERL